MRLSERAYSKIKDLEEAFGINLSTDKIINIKGIEIPNLYLNPLTKMDTRYNFEKHEFVHSLHKIFYLSNYNNTNLTCYEKIGFEVPTNKIVFDCGANIGIFSSYAAFKNNKVYAFEPSSVARKNLRIAQKVYNSIVIVPKGIGAKSESGFLYQMDNLAATHRNSYALNQYNKVLYKEKAEFTSIDDFSYSTRIFPDYIKADIEGAELDLLYGARQVIQEYGPQLSIAFHNGYEIGTAMKLFPNYIWDVQHPKTDESPILIGKRSY